MRVKGTIVSVVMIITLMMSSVVAYAGMSAKNVEGKYGNVTLHYFINREVAPYGDYLTWSYNVFGEDIDALTFNAYGYYLKTNRKRESEKVIRKFANENICAYEKKNRQFTTNENWVYSKDICFVFESDTINVDRTIE